MAISPSLFLSELTFQRSSVVKVVVKGMTSSFQFFGKRTKCPQNIGPQTPVWDVHVVTLNKVTSQMVYHKCFLKPLIRLPHSPFHISTCIQRRGGAVELTISFGGGGCSSEGGGGGVNLTLEVELWG